MLSALVIGCGRIAGGFDEHSSQTAPVLTHAGAIRRRADMILTACVDHDATRAESFAKYWGIPKWYTDVDAINGIHFDVILVCTPTEHHSDSIIAALQFSPRVIFTEKPISPTLANSQSLVSVCQSQGVPLIVNYSRYWDSILSQRIYELRAGIHGSIQSVAGVYSKGLLNNGSHMLEILLRLFGTLDVAWARARPTSHLQEDRDVDVMLLGDECIPVTLTCVNANYYNLFELQIFTERGELRMRDGGISWSTRAVTESEVFTGYRQLSHEISEEGGYFSAMINAMEFVANTALGFQSSQTNAHHALAAQRLCEIIFELAQ